MCKIHPNYLSTKPILSGKLGRNFNYFLADASTQLSLYKLGYKYYTKKSLNYFGSDLLLKIIDSYFENDILMCTCQDTLNFTYKLKATDLLLNV